MSNSKFDWTEDLAGRLGVTFPATRPRIFTQHVQQTF